MLIVQNELGSRANDCSLGILVMEGLQNICGQDNLAPARQNLINTIREQYKDATRADLKALAPMAPYICYYKDFGYTYHVLPQLESIIKGKEIPDGLPPVEAMFMAELKNMLLTAGHDIDKLEEPIRLVSSTGQESYITLSGREVSTIPGDIMIADRQGVISSILRGPDQRTAITADTKQVVYMTYALNGVGQELVSTFK